MKLLNTYEDQSEAEKAASLIIGEKRLYSDREDNKVIYKLLGEPTWGNFHRLGMFGLPDLQQLLEVRNCNQTYDQAKHKEIVKMLGYVAKQFDLVIPEHWS
jgi:hypothetical protein